MPSRPTGKPDSADELDDDERPAPRGKAAIDGKVTVELQHARGQHIRWILIGGILGVLFVIGLGTLGKALGVVLLGIAAWNAFLLVRTLLQPPGTLVIGDDTVELPRGICRGAPARVPRSQVTSAYFLRRAVPWTQASPVLVIEAAGRAFSFPRDWFAEEGDQRRVLDALVP